MNNENYMRNVFEFINKSIYILNYDICLNKMIINENDKRFIYHILDLINKSPIYKNPFDRIIYS